MMTRWAAEVSPDNVWQEYPRSQMVREQWLNLNGLWDYAVVGRNADRPDRYDGEILVPFPIESALSGVGKTVGGSNRLWYRRTFEVPRDWSDEKVLLHFEAVDWETTVWVNGNEIGSHRGGYDRFSFDVTDVLNDSGPQELVLAVWDPTDRGTQPRGKQVSRPRGIFYTAVTGIWQTVWIEPVNETHIESLKIVPNIDTSMVTIRANYSGVTDGLRLQIETDSGLTASGDAGAAIVLPVIMAKLWSPDSPYLYDFKATLTDSDGNAVDTVSSYFGMRKIALGKDENGVTRLFLNNEPLFQFGPLDQGWWPDGLYTAPTDDALRYDVEVTKQLGFNMARKHVKSEPDRWYYWCDKLGLLVWQDMPSGDRGIGPNEPDFERSRESAEQFDLELVRMLDRLGNHPSIVMWVPFNEGWGQSDTVRIVNLIKGHDPSRLVDCASGWSDRGVGAVHDVHSYPGPAMPELEEDRAAVLGEFGGLGLPLQGHLWQEEGAWGYRAYQNQQELTDAYRNLIKNLHPMIEKGLAAAVYTQTSDVETEVNGLMTYDRAVIKMDVDEFNRINNGYFPPVVKSENDIFVDSTAIEVSNAGQIGEIRYTLDGSVPTKSAALYEAPVTVTETTTLTARIFWPDGTHSGVSEHTCEKVSLREPAQVDDLDPGLEFDYYEDASESLNAVPDFAQLTPKTSGIAARCDLTHAERDDWFSMKFEGFVRARADGVYTFYTNSDDGSFLYIGSEEVVQNDGSHPMNEVGGQVALKAGLYPVKVTFYQGMGGKGLEVSYKGPGIEKQQIPPEALFHKTD